LPTRDDAWKLLLRVHRSPKSLRKHMLAVGSVRFALRPQAGADEELWQSPLCCTTSTTSAGPIEAQPRTRATRRRRQILRAQGYSEEYRPRDPLAPRLFTLPVQSPLETSSSPATKLAGFLTACAYVRPSKSILGLEVDSVKRRLKDKAFAAGSPAKTCRSAEEAGRPRSRAHSLLHRRPPRTRRRLGPPRHHNCRGRALVLRCLPESKRKGAPKPASER